mgnify:CR=1 FL=1
MASAASVPALAGSQVSCLANYSWHGAYGNSWITGIGAQNLLGFELVLPDGEVRPVPHEQVYITSHLGEEAAVSDQRDLVIPFGGLGPGMVVDYCIQYPAQPFLDIGTSWEYRFGDFAHQREEILELFN